MNDPTGGLPTWRAKMDKAAWKWREASLLILRHRYTTERILAEAFGLSRSRTKATVAKWIRAGLMRKKQHPAWPEKLVLLTRQGAIDGMSALGIAVKYKTDSSTIGPTLLGHTLAVQQAAIEWAKSDYKTGLQNYKLYEAEAVMRGAAKQAKVDARTLDDNDALTLIEVELSRKNPQRLTRKMEDLAGTLQAWNDNPEEDKAIALWYCPAGMVENGLRRALEADWEANWLKQQVGNIHIRTFEDMD